MINSNYTEEETIQNLKDAGCDSAAIAAFLKEVKSGKSVRAMKLLEKHRRTLLDDLHENQKQIDCLDYLVYQMKKEEKTKA
jgi:hypothetical protein